MPFGPGNFKSNRPRSNSMRFHDLTFPQLRQVPRDQTVVLAPIAACEQHSRHLPTFTDTILCTAVAEGVEQRLPKQVLLLPTTCASARRCRPTWTRTSPSCANW
jgi:creatinine amidohydrolase/Fe(II)-dependent formamide hydrolase-like protein